MERLLVDFTDVIDFNLDDSQEYGLITLRAFPFFDITQKNKTIIKSRGERFTQFDTIQTMIESAQTENVFAYDSLGQIVFLVTKDQVRTLCDATAYIIGLEVFYETKDLQYITSEENATYNLIVRTSKTQDIVYAGKHMSFSDIANIMKVLDDKSDIRITGYNIYKITRSMDSKN